MPDYDLITILDLPHQARLLLLLLWPMNSTQKLSVPTPARYTREWILAQGKTLPTIQ